MSKHKTLYIEIDDEITSVAEKLRQTTQENVTVVIPKGAVLLQSVVNLRLLKRIAEKSGKHIAVVAADATSKNLIARAGLVLQHGVSDPFPEGAEADVIEPKEKPVSSTLTLEIDGKPDKKLAVKGYEPEDADDDSDEDEGEEARAPKAVAVKKLTSSSEPARKNFARVTSLDRNEKPKEDRAARLAAIKSKRSVGMAKSRLPRNFARFAVLFAGVAAIIVIVILMMTLPKATITIVPKTEATSDTININVLASGKPSATLNQVSGKYIETTKQDNKNFPATGQKDFGKKATGTVSLSNLYSSSAEVLPAGTKLKTASGNIYLLDAPVTIPGATVVSGSLVAGIATGKASAEKSGEAYNIGTTGLTIVGLPTLKQGKVTAASSGFADGSTDVQTVVSADDIAKAKDATEKEAKDQAREDLKGKVEAGATLQDDAIAYEIKEEKSLVSQDAKASAFDYSVTVIAKGITYVENDVKSAAVTALSDKLQGQKTLLESDSGNFAYTVKKLDVSVKSLLLATTVQKKAVPNIDLSKAPQELAGKTDSEIRGYFANTPEIDAVKIVFWPFWVKHAPKNSSRTQIVLDTQ